MTHKLIKTTDYILVVDDSEIQKGDCYLSPSGIWFYNHLNPNHNKESKKVCAHLPLNGSPILEGVDLLPPIEDCIERLAEIFGNNVGGNESESIALSFGYKKGYNKAREKYKYTEEDVVHLLHKTARKYFQEGREYKGTMAIAGDPLHGVRPELMNMVQSLHQYPTEFKCEMIPCNPIKYTTEDHLDVEPKTITTAKGVQWVGKYK